MEDTFESKISSSDLDEILPICSEYNIDPLTSSESEEFFLKLISSAREGDEDIATSLRKVMKEQFISISSPPNWIQGSDWQFAKGQPMVFVGQIDLPVNTGYFHDDASFYVFWDPKTGIRKTIIQVA